MAWFRQFLNWLSFANDIFKFFGLVELSLGNLEVLVTWDALLLLTHRDSSLIPRNMLWRVRSDVAVAPIVDALAPWETFGNSYRVTHLLQLLSRCFSLFEYKIHDAGDTFEGEWLFKRHPLPAWADHILPYSIESGYIEHQPFVNHRVIHKQALRVDRRLLSQFL